MSDELNPKSETPLTEEPAILRAKLRKEAAEFQKRIKNELRFNTLPNQLTLIRILFVPVVVAFLLLQESKYDFVAALLFAVASITDYFDGYLARKQKLITIYGKLLDPLADKFLVVCSLIALQENGRIHPSIVMLLICREMAITGLRALASAEGIIIDASGGGKWKTAIQMFAIPFLMLKDSQLGFNIYPLGQLLLIISLLLSLWSAKDYIVSFFKALGERRKKRAQERKALRIELRVKRKARKLKDST